MNREDNIYNRYREIMDIYEPIKQRVWELRSQRDESSNQIKLMEDELERKIREVNNDDRAKDESIDKKFEKSVEDIMGWIIVILWVCFAVSNIKELFETDNMTIIAFILPAIGRIIASLIPAFLTSLVIGFPLYLINDIIVKEYLKSKHKKISKKPIKELEFRLEEEKDNLEAIKEELSIKDKEIINYMEIFREFLGKISYM